MVPKMNTEKCVQKSLFSVTRWVLCYRYYATTSYIYYIIMSLAAYDMRTDRMILQDRFMY